MVWKILFVTYILASFQVLHVHRFSNGLSSSTESKQWRIELLYRYKRVKTRRVTVLNVPKLYFTLLTLKLNCMFTLSGACQSQNPNYVCTTPGKSPVHCTLLAIRYLSILKCLPKHTYYPWGTETGEAVPINHCNHEKCIPLR